VPAIRQIEDAQLRVPQARASPLPSPHAQHGGEGSGVGGRPRAQPPRSFPSHPRHCRAHHCSRNAVRDSRARSDPRSAAHQLRCHALRCVVHRRIRSQGVSDGTQSPRSTDRWSPDGESESRSPSSVEGAAREHARHPSGHAASRERAARDGHVFSHAECASSAPHPRPLPAIRFANGGRGDAWHRRTKFSGGVRSPSADFALGRGRRRPLRSPPPMRSMAGRGRGWGEVETDPHPTFPIRRMVSSARRASSSQNLAKSAAG